MKHKCPYRTRGRNIIGVVSDWLESRELDVISTNGSSVKYGWCGEYAAEVSETSYDACRLVLADWVVQELIECDRVPAVGEVTIIRNSKGLDSLRDTLVKVFDKRAKPLRYETKASTAYHEMRRAIHQRKLGSEDLTASEKLQLHAAIESDEVEFACKFDDICKRYAQMPPPNGYSHSWKDWTD